MTSSVPAVAMKLNAMTIPELLGAKPGRYILHNMERYRMREANGTDVIVTENGRNCFVEPIAAHMDDLMNAS
jgi:hypothetical protein